MFGTIINVITAPSETMGSIVNDFNWSSKDIYFNSGISTKILSNFKNINYEAKNVDLYKKDLSNEVYGALGLMSELKLQKLQNNSQHILKPKVLVRYAPDKMRKETSGSRLSPITAFKVNKLNNINNFKIFNTIKKRC